VSEPVLWLSIVIDEACGQIWDAWANGAAVTSLRVSPEVYRAVASARPGEVARDFPLMLLGLPLIADGLVGTYQPVAVRSAAGPAHNGHHGNGRPGNGLSQATEATEANEATEATEG
jgi:hypothetical protein